MLNLLRGLAARHLIFIALCTLLLAGFEFLLCGIVVTVDLGGVLKEVLKSLPAFLQTFLSEQAFAGMTVRGMLAFGWNHPVAIMLGAAVAVALAARAVAGEIENGALELLLSQPVSRSRYLLAHILFALASLAVMSLAGVFGTFLGQKYYGLNLFAGSLLMQLALNFFLLHAAWFGLALLLSVLARESRRVSGPIFLLLLVSYILQTLGKLWTPAAALLPFSLFNYYAPLEILVLNFLAAKSLGVLAGVFVLSIGVSLWQFQRRDLP